MLGLLFAGSHPLAFALVTALVLYGTEARAPLAVLAAVLAFAALDELHQLFMPGRSAAMLDFVADAAAAAAVCGALLIRRKPICAELSQP